jgi:hypothetical protein
MIDVESMKQFLVNFILKMILSTKLPCLIHRNKIALQNIKT